MLRLETERIDGGARRLKPRHVELHPRLRGEDPDGAPGGRIVHLCGGHFESRRAQHEVAVPAALRHLLTDRVQVAEIVGRTGYACDLSGRNRPAIERRIGICVNTRLIAENRRRRIITKVEIGVVGEVDDRRFVGRRQVLDLQRGVAMEFNECEPHMHGQRSGKAHVAVRRNQRHFHAVWNLFRGPGLYVKSDRAAVQSDAIGAREDVVRLSVERELAMIDAIGVAANGRSHDSSTVHITLHAVVPQHHVAHFPFSVRHADAHNARAICGDFHFGFGRSDRVQFDRRSRGILPPVSVRYRGGRDGGLNAQAGGEKY